MSNFTPEPNQEPQDPLQYDEIDLKELFLVLWSGKLLIAIVTFLAAVGSVFYALSIPNQYKATTLLAPTQADGGGLSGALGQLEGLASLAGVSIGVGETNESQIAQEIMKSWSFIERFIADNKLEVGVYAVKDWDKTSGELQIDDEIYDIGAGSWLLEDATTGVVGAPTSWELYKRFDEMTSVSQNVKSGLVSVSVEYYSPVIAKEWLDLYVDAINKHMQARQVEKVSRNIKYLEAQIEKTSISEMREVFYSLIEEQIKNKMVAEASPQYTFYTVRSSMIPEEKSQPKRASICILGTLLGTVLGGLIVLLRHYALPK